MEQSEHFAPTAHAWKLGAEQSGNSGHVCCVQSAQIAPQNGRMSALKWAYGNLGPYTVPGVMRRTKGEAHPCIATALLSKQTLPVGHFGAQAFGECLFCIKSIFFAVYTDTVADYRSLDCLIKSLFVVS